MSKKLLDLTRTLSAPFERVEQALIDAYYARRLESASGVRLDDLGKLVGQPRDGFGDTDYRRVIGARIAINRSTGVRSDLIRIALAILNTPGSKVRVTGGGGVAFVDTWDTAVSTPLATLIYKFLREAIEATVRLGVVYTTTPGNAFAFSPDDNDLISPDGFADDAGLVGGNLTDVIG
jgi:hypothetical protein